MHFTEHKKKEMKKVPRNYKRVQSVFALSGIASQNTTQIDPHATQNAICVATMCNTNTHKWGSPRSPNEVIDDRDVTVTKIQQIHCVSKKCHPYILSPSNVGQF